METRSLVSFLLMTSTTLLFGENTKSSLSPTLGDKNVAPISDDRSVDIPGDKVLPPKFEAFPLLWKEPENTEEKSFLVIKVKANSLIYTEKKRVNP